MTSPTCSRGSRPSGTISWRCRTAPTLHPLCTRLCKGLARALHALRTRSAFALHALRTRSAPALHPLLTPLCILRRRVRSTRADPGAVRSNPPSHPASPSSPPSRPCSSSFCTTAAPPPHHRRTATTPPPHLRLTSAPPPPHHRPATSAALGGLPIFNSGVLAFRRTPAVTKLLGMWGALVLQAQRTAHSAQRTAHSV